MNTSPKVALIMGSDSDWPELKSCTATLTQFSVPFEVRVISAHRTPELAAEYASTARDRGIKVLLCAAGGAAHLAGVIAAHTTLPVIGIPMAGGKLNGLDALLATVQMPSGIPVATVALGSGGPTNAALLAIQMLALSDEQLASALAEHKKKLVAKVEAANARIVQELSNP